MLDTKDGVKIDLGSGCKQDNKEQHSYWLVAQDGKPKDLVRQTGKRAVSVLATEALTKHKRLMDSDFFPMDERFEYIALTSQEFGDLCAPEKLAGFVNSESTAAHGRRHSEETRRIVVESVVAGRSMAAICHDFKVSRAAAYRWVAEAQ